MKPNELRVGSIVNIYKQPETIEYLHEVISVEEYGCLIHCGEESDFIPFSEIQGVRLTEEWLRYFGFDDKEYKDGYIGIDVTTENGFTTDFVLCKPSVVAMQSKYGFEFRAGNLPFRINFTYVHELQNFFFCLKKEELKAK